MTREIFVHLFAASTYLFWLELGPDGMLFGIMVHMAVTVEAQRNRIFDVVTTPRDNMMYLDVRTARFLA